MTAPETPDHLRARLDALAIAASRSPRTLPPIEEEQRAWEEFATAALDAWPDIDALLARLTAAEAELDRLTTGLDIFFDQAKGMRGPERGRLAHALLRDFWRILARRRTSDVKRHCVRGRDDGWWQCVDCDEAFPTWPDDFVPCPKGRP